MSMWALVPVKALSQSKQRLRAVLTPPERQALTVAMLRDVLAAAGGAAELAGVMLVSRCPRAARVGHEAGARVFAEASSADLSAAITQASQYVAERYQASGTVVLPSDMPLITAPDIDRLLAAHAQVTLVPDRHGEGTNALVCSPPNALRYHFGTGSFARHRRAALTAGLTPRLVRHPRIGQDIDEPDDLARLAKALAPSHTQECLGAIPLEERLDSVGAMTC